MKKYIVYAIASVLLLSSCGLGTKDEIYELEKRNRELYIENINLSKQIKIQSKRIDELINSELGANTKADHVEEIVDEAEIDTIEQINTPLDLVQIGLTRDANSEYAGAEIIIPKTEKPIKMLILELEALDGLERKAYCSVRNTSTTILVLNNPPVGIINKENLWKNKEIKYINTISVDAYY